jgi:hypothetical protein
MKKATLENVADGVAKELFAHELEKVMANVMDQNTSHKAKRTITMTFEFSPDETRDEVLVAVNSKAKLAPVKGYAKTMFTGKQDGKIALFGQDTKQIDMFTDTNKVAPINANQAAQ